MCFTVNSSKKESQELRKITSCSDFKTTLRTLLESNSLTDEEKIRKDLGERVYQRMVNHVTEIKVFDPEEPTKPYFSFINCIANAMFGTAPYKEILNECLHVVMDFSVCSGKNVKVCAFLFNLFIQVVDLSNESIEKALMRSILQMNDLLEQSRVWSDQERVGFEVREKFSQFLFAIDGILVNLFNREKKLENKLVADKLLKLYVKLYKMFQNKTNIEAKTDITEFKLILQAIELSMSIFENDKVYLVKSLISYWPTAKPFQVEAIKTFMSVCQKLLKSKDRDKIENVLLKKLNELLLNSNSLMFSEAHKQLKELKTFWLSKCSEEQKQLFVRREYNMKEENDSRVESSRRRENKLNTNGQITITIEKTT